MRDCRRRRWRAIAAVVGLVVLVAVNAFPQAGPMGQDTPLQYESLHIGTLRRVPQGTFQRDGTATNTTTVSAFYMSEHAITQAQYVAVTGKDNPSWFSEGDDTANRPVMRVSWYDTLVFCNMLSIAEGRTPVYTIGGSTDPGDWGEVPTDRSEAWDAAIMNVAANGYRLPTEAEWMWAAMGATLDARNGAFDASGVNRTGYTKGYAGSSEDGSSNDRIEDYAWYSDNSGATTHPVGVKRPNELGLYDMSGNMSEWTWDWWASYPEGQLEDPTGPVSLTGRILRGGSWNTDASHCSVAHRINTFAYFRTSFSGFRVVSR